ncbi:competence/damage-inducible protein A [Rhodopirellula bahusiensis]|uniref:Competence/damage-inducible protein A n=1 Tax=Rhodopirellula bahusiensis TaxID=2014065 RepID=A0A2G1WDH4_9BACT|nr:molybdopterin-binding protein [Rhodopirellula bahusiensis]PHQ37056.1 competence/damage-inducible protein A [Rhodopirellula bahusiensis]
MPHITAEIISIGDEMITGARLDTNTQWLSQRLGELGVDVQFHTTVADTLSHNTDVFRIAARRADLVIATGGLGPTRDDLTREAIAESLGRPLQLHEPSLKFIESMFQRRGREMPERNQSQAMFPIGAVPIHNPQGTAPGIDVRAPREDGTQSRIFALPGVPAEMKTMFDETVAPAVLGSNGQRRHIAHHVMKFFGVGESDMEQRLGDMIARDRQPRVGITVSAATISLRIVATGETMEACGSASATTRDEILRKAGEFYFGDGETFEQHHAVVQHLNKVGQRLLLVELGRAAPLGDWFAAVSDEPGFTADVPAFVGGISLANVDDLRQWAGMPADASVETCLSALRQRVSADWVLLVDEYPSLHQTNEHPLPGGEVTFTVAAPDESFPSITQHLGAHPSILHARVAKAGLFWLRKCFPTDPSGV